MPIDVLPHPHFESLLDGFGNPVRVDGPRRQPVIIPSLAFRDYLQQRLALRHGISMGLRWLMPRDFIHSAVGPGPHSPWNRDRFCWHVLSLIDTVLPDLGVDENLSQRDRFALANLMADRLDQYGHFRPDWIEAWNQSKPATSFASVEGWQSQLWRDLRDRLPVGHPALVLRDHFENADFLAELKDRFPRLIVLASGNLDPLLVTVLRLLDHAGAEVVVRVILPSMGYLEFLKDFAGSEAQAVLPEDVEVPCGHPLLKSMGRNAIGTFALLGQLDEQYQHWSDIDDKDTESNPVSSLDQLQSDLRNLRRPTVIEEGDDATIALHSCFGPRRELETVREEIQRCFASLPYLQPADIHIAAPSLENYAPLVGAVFHHGPRPLPVRLTAVAARQAGSVPAGLQLLLGTVVDGVYPASGVLELLYLPGVQQALECKSPELPRNLLINSGFTHGLGDNQPGRFAHAIRRLVAGTWMEHHSQETYPNGAYILPVTDELGDSNAWRRKFHAWLSELDQLFHEWQQPVFPEEWAGRFQSAATVLLSGDPDDLACLQPHLRDLRELPYDELLEVGTLHDWFSARLDPNSPRQHTSGKIAFGTLQHLQNLPCRVLILVGMDGGFPGQNRSPSWDLMRKSPRIWDRNTRVDQRQLFLDALLAPTDRLIITAPNRNPRSGKTEPFSPCVEELRRTLTAMRATCRVVEHSLQPYSPAYFRGEGSLPRSFDACQAKISETVFNSDKRSPQPFWQPVEESSKDESTDLSKWRFGRDLPLNELCRFWRDPARAFARSRRLLLWGEDAPDTDLDLPPMDLESLMLWQVRQALLEREMHDAPPKPYLRAVLIANRQLPPGHLGSRYWESLADQIEAFCERLRPLIGETRELQLSPARDVALHWEIQESKDAEYYILYGLQNFSKQKAKLDVWLRALLISASAHPRPLHLYSLTEKDPLIFTPLEERAALEQLETLLQGYIEGHEHPLPFAPETSARIAKEIEKNPDLGPDDVRSKCLNDWGYNPFTNRPGEGMTPEAEVVWRGRDPFAEENLPGWIHWAKEVSREMNEWESEARVQ